MRFRHGSKRLAFDLLCQPAVNGLLRRALKPVSFLLPAGLKSKIPVVGSVSVPLPRARRLILTSDGRENLASVIYWNGFSAFEPETIAVYFRLLAGCRTVFDVGAYMGLYALLAALDSPDRQVHAFEPVPQNFERLRANLRANRLGNVRAVQAAAGKADGEIQLYLPSCVWLPSNASTRPGFRKTERTLTASVMKLDTYAAQSGVGRVDLIKIDTEGSEPEVLEGAREMLARDRPLIICEVLKGLTEKELNSILAEAGYAFFLITGAGLAPRERIVGDEAHANRNYLFAARERVGSLPRELFAE